MESVSLTIGSSYQSSDSRINLIGEIEISNDRALDWKKNERNYNDLISTINSLIKDIVNLKNEIGELKQQIEELYYAPGAPGYIKSQESFEKVKKRKI